MSDKVIRNSKIPIKWISEVFLKRGNNNKNAKLCFRQIIKYPGACLIVTNCRTMNVKVIKNLKQPQKPNKVIFLICVALVFPSKNRYLVKPSTQIG